MSSCVDLAATLNSNYWNTLPFNHSVSTLPDYLDSHGVLLTKCWPYPRCMMVPSDNHVSASWINVDLGFQRLLPSATPMGLILDPRAVEISCVYPTDAGTLDRDDNGCGPMSMDAERGSRGAHHLGPLARFLAKRQVLAFKNLNFGRDTPFAEIPCDAFLDLSGGFADILGWSLEPNDASSSSSWHREPMLVWWHEQQRAIVGHEICQITDGEPRVTPSHWFLYTGADSWKVPEQWQDAMDWQKELMSLGPKLWNEINLKVPAQMSDIALAVVYFVPAQEDPDRNETQTHNLAKEVSRRLGNKPVLKVDLRAKEEEFVCVEDETTETPNPHRFRGSAGGATTSNTGREHVA